MNHDAIEISPYYKAYVRYICRGLDFIGVVSNF
ncbi:hypothetical protein TNCT_231, partial [Trichonephila clavata]